MPTLPNALPMQATGLRTRLSGDCVYKAATLAAALLLVLSAAL